MCFMNAIAAQVLNELGFSYAGVGAVSAAALLVASIAVTLVKSRIRLLKPYNIRLVGMILVTFSYTLGIWPS